MRKPFIIAELGSSPAPAWDFEQWCEGARAAGADAVKVQIFHHLSFPEHEQAEKEKLEFPRYRINEFVQAAHAFGLMAGASAFDSDAVWSVSRNCDFLKLAAREQGNDDLIMSATFAHSDYPKPLYRSISDFRYFGNGEKSPRVVTLFTIQSYPAGMVRSLMALFKAALFFNSLGERWGWSSHTTGALDCVMASRLGAEVIEKHFCLGTANIESGHSLLPHQFAAMVERIRK